MKKSVLLLALALVLAFGAIALVGCGGSEEPAEPTDGGTAVAPEIQAIKDAGVLKAGVKVDVPNFGLKDPASGEIDGFEIDLVRALADRLLGDPTAITLEPVTAKTRGPLLDSGQLDVVFATFTINDERKTQWNFSQPYYQDTVGLLVKKDSGLTTLADFDGKTIGVAQGATSRDAVQAEADALGIKVSFLEFATYPEINAALESGRVDAFCVDKSILTGYLTDDSVILADAFSPQDYGAAAKLGNDALTAEIDAMLNEMVANGEMDALLAKWNLK